MRQRRRFLASLGGLGAVLVERRPALGDEPPQQNLTIIPAYARAQNYQTRKQSSYDRTGGNHDFWSIAAGQTSPVFESSGPGIITHLWFTIDAQSPNHLKELVLRAYWEGNAQPAVETPIGDFFGLNLGRYFLYQSAFLNCSPVKALNAYFAMPFRRSARITVTNEGAQAVNAFYSNIDYRLVPAAALPHDVLYFHAQYRQAVPNEAVTFAPGQSKINLDGRRNYVFMETRGSGHLMGVTLGVVANADGWFGEGDDMTFIGNDQRPAINGTGTEDYFCGAWDFGGPDKAVPFANLYNGAPFINMAEHAGGRYCLYRWHADNPIAFQGYMKHTIEHGHADDRADSFYSVAYWYQREASAEMPALPAVGSRLVR